MKQTQKFMFDTNDFNVDPAAEEKAPVFTEEQVLTARKEGYAQGRADAAKEARQSQEEKITQACDKILNHAEKLLAAESLREIQKQAETLDITLAVVKKIAPSLASAGALAEALKTVNAALEERREEPRIVITVHDNIFQQLKERVDKMAADRGFTGKVIVMADAALPPADCRVEWADGGSERSFERVITAISDEIKKVKETLTTSGEMK